MGPCSFGKGDPITGSCIYLIYKEDLGVCSIVRDGNKKAIRELKINMGCQIRSKDSNMDYLLDEYVKAYKNLGD